MWNYKIAMGTGLLLSAKMASRLMKMFCAELKLFWKYSLRTQSVICKFWLLIDWTSQKSTASQKEEIICDSVTAKIFERRASCWSSDWPRTQGSNSVDLGTSSNEIKVSFKYKFASEVYFR